MSQKDGTRATDLFVIQNESQLANKLRVVAVILKCNEAESLGSASFTVDHNGGVDNLSELGKENTH